MKNLTDTYRFFFIIPIAVIIFCLPGCKSKKDRAVNAKPNIIFIMADDMGIGDLGCYNQDSKISTPHIDSLASAGIRFTDAHAPASVCSPTRYGVLTGRYAWRTRLQQRGVPPWQPLLIDTARITVADLLKSQGYATGIIGKWHLGFTLKDSVDYLVDSLYPGPLELGFDYFFGLPGSIGMAPFCFVEGHHTVGIPDIPKPDSVFGEKGYMVKNWRHEDVGPILTGKAVEFIENHLQYNSDIPFYLHLVTSAPHRPCLPPDFIRCRSSAGPRGDMVAEVDWTVGEVVKTLKKHGILGNTLIVITSDNGAIPGEQPNHGVSHIPQWEMYNHKPNLDYRGFKTHIWEGGHIVPFIVYWHRKITPGSLSDETICLTDWMATLAGLFGVQLPGNAGEDSYNILPAILGESYNTPIREALVSHSMLGMSAIRKGEWKLIFGTDGGGEKDRTFEPVDLAGDQQGQLYNLKDDPRELDNLWNEYPDIVAELSELLEKYKTSGKSNY